MCSSQMHTFNIQSIDCFAFLFETDIKAAFLVLRFKASQYKISEYIWSHAYHILNIKHLLKCVECDHQMASSSSDVELTQEIFISTTYRFTGQFYVLRNVHVFIFIWMLHTVRVLTVTENAYKCEQLVLWV